MNDKNQLWSKNNGIYSRVPAGVIEEFLVPSIYMLKFNPNMGYYLTELSDFTVPDKLYGTIETDVNRIFTTYHQRENSTGTLLSGVMGSGKTLMAKLISHKALKIGMPTIIVQHAYSDPGFMEFIQNIKHECVILFEEMDKVYEDISEQNKILSLFDGIYSNKKLFIVTANASRKISNFILNRPGRCFYHLKFTGLDMAFIEDYCNHNLNNKSQIKSILIVSQLVFEFNFDQLQALVQEMNNYNESAMQALKWLNIEAVSKYQNWQSALYINNAFVTDTNDKIASYVFTNFEKLHDTSVLPYEMIDINRSIELDFLIEDMNEQHAAWAMNFIKKYNLNETFEFDFPIESMTECDILNNRFVFEIEYNGLKIKRVYTEFKPKQSLSADRFKHLLA